MSCNKPTLKPRKEKVLRWHDYVVLLLLLVGYSAMVALAVTFTMGGFG
jgi:hypothetical protein